MEPRKYQQFEKRDALKIEEFLNAVRDIQSINVDNIWPHLSQGSKHSYPDVSETLSQTSVRDLASENERLRKELELEKEFKQEYFKVFGNKEMKDVNRAIDHMEGEIERLQEENAKLHKTNTRLEEDMRKAVKEKDSAMTRFNQQTNIRATDNTTDISDMCDQTRPNKIGARYRNLYDTLWTDAFELLTETKRCTEKEAIEILLKLLIECHNFANMRANKQMTELVQVITGDPTMQAGDSLIAQLKAARKLMNVTRADLLYQECEKQIKDKGQFYRLYLYEKEVTMYLFECFQICWMMAIQDPPLVMGMETKHTDHFDTDLYKHFTTSGSKVDFVVLPPLFLQEGGPLLERGVAQSRKELSETGTTYGTAKNNGNTIGNNERPIGKNTDDCHVELSSMTKTPIINDTRHNTNLSSTTIPTSSSLAITSNRFPFTLRNQPSTTEMSQSIPTSYKTELVRTSYKPNSQSPYGGVNIGISSMPNSNLTNESWNKANRSQQDYSGYNGSASSTIGRESASNMTQSTYVPSSHAGNSSTGYDGLMTSRFQNTTDWLRNETRSHLNSTGQMTNTTYFHDGRGYVYGYKP
ncbi:hypothetical protein ACJMK2_030585 [Sinanodonta woodiana]|uniref:Mitochondria-eating protein C-terminal domain-containing protein n=1 Tax=Sinanodonta woodiana TaxID=1069815 RepID=A0ABD3WWQ9_SINWO